MGTWCKGSMLNDAIMFMIKTATCFLYTWGAAELVRIQQFPPINANVGKWFKPSVCKTVVSWVRIPPLAPN